MLTTIRGRLQAGFGVTVLLILAAGALAIVGLQQAGRRSESLVSDLRHETESVQQVAYRMLQEVAAGMRYINTSAPKDAEHYAALGAEADQLRRAAVTLAGISSGERQRLE